MTGSIENGSTNNNENRKNGSRPVSFYDNFQENGSTESAAKESTFPASPTQAHCLTTTVPQNIAAENFANKHTPNRNSLRHSRMIAMTKGGQDVVPVPKKYLPAIIRYHRLAKALLGLITLLGLAICFLSLWLSIWAPNLNQRDNPSWSGLPVLLSGIFGLTLLCCFRKEYPGMQKSYFVYGVKVVSVVTSAVAAIASLTACAFSIIHLVTLQTTDCAPPKKLDESCLCRSASSDGTTYSVSYHYTDLTCLEVDNILPILVIFSCASNLLAGVLEVWYVYLHWASRYVYTYSKVRTEDDRPTVLSNER